MIFTYKNNKRKDLASISDEARLLTQLDQSFVFHTICRYYPWNTEQLDNFINQLNWNEISINSNIKWSSKLIEKFENKLNFGDYGLTSNESIPFTPELIEKYKNKWDWTFLTDNSQIPWTIDLLEKYQDYWAWESYEFAGNLGLSLNRHLPWSIDILEKFKEKWFWGELSANPALPWNLELIKRFEDLWTWDGHYGYWGLSMNTSPIVKQILLEYYPEKIDKKYNSFLKQPQIINSELDIITKTILSVFADNIECANYILSSLAKNVSIDEPALWR